MENRIRTQRYYDTISRDYLEKHNYDNAGGRYFIQRVGGLLSKRMEESSVLELGCGPGIFLSLFPDGIGVDFSRTMIFEAKKVLLNPLVVADINHLPFRDNSFDASYSVNVLYHSEDPRKVVGEALRVARNRHVIVDYNPLCPWWYIQSFLDGRFFLQKNMLHLIGLWSSSNSFWGIIPLRIRNVRILSLLKKVERVLGRTWLKFFQGFMTIVVTKNPLIQGYPD